MHEKGNKLTGIEEGCGAEMVDGEEEESDCSAAQSRVLKESYDCQSHAAGL